MPVTTRAAARALAGDALPPAGEGDPAAQGNGEQVLRLLVELATPRKKRPAPDHAGAAGSSSSSAPPAPPAIKLSPATLLGVLHTSAGMAEHVVRHAARTRLTLTSGATAATARFAAHANDLTLALQGAIPAIASLGAAALARVRRLELHNLLPTRAQLATLAQQLPSLEEVALVCCALGKMEQQQPPPQQQQRPQKQPSQRHAPAAAAARVAPARPSVRQPNLRSHPAAAQVATTAPLAPARPLAAAPPLPPSLLRLDVRSCRMSDGIQGFANEGAAFTVALSLLRAPDQLRHLDTTTPAHLVMEHLSALPGLTSITLGDATRVNDPRPLLQHPSLTHVTLPGPLGLWNAPPRPEMRAGHRWQRLAVVDGDAGSLDGMPLSSIDSVVLERGLRAHARMSGSWKDLVAKAREAGTALRCEPDEEGRFSIDGRREQALADLEDGYGDDDVCGDCDVEWDACGRCPECGISGAEEWAHWRNVALLDCFERCEDAIEFVAQHLPKEGGHWHLVLEDCQKQEPKGYGTRTLAGVLGQHLRNSKVASWERKRKDDAV